MTTRNDSLSAYRTKRRFGATPEPPGRIAKPGKTLAFVVQKHAARRLHYDFRLELDGTLKSWAVPKGPCLDPKVRRMAVQVEDHPLDYAGFEGVIPAGHYGAGTVIVWDRGTWVPHTDPRAAYAEGKLKFELHGEKLTGGWTLVRTRGDGDTRQQTWLLIKEKDAAARPLADYDIEEAEPDSVNEPRPARVRKKAATVAATKPRAARAANAVSRAPAAQPATAKQQRAPRADATSTGAAGPGGASLVMPDGAKRAALPLAFAPQLATLVSDAPREGDWIYEIKFDGYRILARIDGKDVRLFTRNGHDWSAKMPGLQRAIAALGLKSGWLDGEAVVLDKHGRTDFQALQNAFDATRTQDIDYFLFDIPYCNGADLRALPLRERRALLRQVLARGTPPLHFSEQFDAPAGELLDAACRLKLEGVIGKRADSEYSLGRSTAWIKLKCTQRQEFVVCGYTDPKGSRVGIGALLLGFHDATGTLRYAGNVGTGFDDATLRRLKQSLAALAADKPPFADKTPGMRPHWVKPKLVAEVSFSAWTESGQLRHPVFHGLRGDKPAGAISRERAVDPALAERAGTRPAKMPRTAGPAGTRVSKRSAVAANPSAEGAETGSASPASGVRVSHPERVIDASTGFTKLDLVDYYERIAPWILPHLKGRPVSLVRGPAGVSGQLFFQKHNDTLRIPGIREFDRALWPAHPPLLEIASVQALAGAAQMNTIELHTWNAKAGAIETPDRIVFDLDPGAGVTWDEVKEGTELTKAMLDELGLASFLKTSGGKGLHVVVPIAPRLDWDTVKDFSRAVVAHLARTIPQRFVVKSGPGNRVGKIFVDYLRNGRGATTVCAFSARARPGLGVSVPIRWDELRALRGADQWNIRTVQARLQRLKADPWAGYAKVRQSLAKAIKRLG